MKDLKKYHNKIGGYSFIEIIVSLAIIAICTIVMLNFTILSFKITAVSLGRSSIREELANIINQVGKDFRRSDFAPVCSQQGDMCEFYIEGDRYRWELCNNSMSVCKDVYDINANSFYNIFTSAENTKITYFKFEPGFSNPAASGLNNIILTIIADHSNETLGIKNIIKQSSFSIRNYAL